VNPQDPNIGRVEVVARALGDLREELVFVGGCAASLLITSPSAPPPRVTYDVDMVAELASLSGYYALEKRLAGLGFTKDLSEGAPICRWRLADIAVDLMPSEERILGFSNRWYPAAVASATTIALPSGIRIRLISAPAFLATKFEAFSGRGKMDVLASHDFEDIVNVLEGRPAVVDDVTGTSPELRTFLVEQFRALSNNSDFASALPGLVAFDEFYQTRIETVRARVVAIASLNIF